MTTAAPDRSTAALPRLHREIDALSAERFLEVGGPRAALLGDERGVFEAWIWPLKVLRRLEPSFRPRGGARVLGREAVRAVEVAPDEVLLRYGGPGWTAALTLFAAPDQRAVVALLEVANARPLEVALELEGELRPMWPAGMGGQSAGLDQPTGALVLTEELGRYAALVGSPEAEPVRAAGDHALPRDPVRAEVHVSPARAARGPVPFFLVGAECEPAPLSEAARRGEDGASRGESRSRAVVELARAAYRAAARDWPRWREDRRRAWRGFLDRTARLTSSEARLDEAFEWAKIAIERAWVEVDGLGRGLVAGLGRSGNGERPGFGWFFDGDALVAARAQVGCGDFAGAREVLRFAAGHQRSDGKLMHELVLSARLCDWLGDYPYAYYKAGNTPAFLAVLSGYVAGSGDLELARELWPCALAAFEYCLRALDEDGLLSVRKAGLAAVEAGPLVGRLRSEVYLQGIWTGAAKGLRDLAGLLGERDVEQRARAAAERAESAFEHFWSPAHGRYGFSLLADGGAREDLSAYLSLPLARGHADPTRAVASAQWLNHPTLAADWGPRMFALDSSLYDPDSYNTGSVFPYLAGHAVLAQYRHGLTASGWQLLASQVGLSGFSGLGFVPEHLRGDVALAPARGVPHQIFSSSAIVQSTLHGLLGLSGHAVEGALLVRPALPPGLDRIELEGYRLGERVLDLRLAREREGGRTRLLLAATLRSGPPLRLFFRPWLPALSRDVVQRLGDRREHAVELAPCGASLAPRSVGIEFPGRAWVALEGELGPEPLLGTCAPRAPGGASCEVRLAGVRAEEDAVTWTLWGPAGSRARVPLTSDRELTLRGATRDDDGALRLRFPSGEGFTPVEVTLEGRP